MYSENMVERRDNESTGNQTGDVGVQHNHYAPVCMQVIGALCLVGAEATDPAPTKGGLLDGNLDEEEKGSAVLRVLESDPPAAVIRDAGTRGLGVEVQTFLDAHYVPSGVGEIWTER